MKGQGIGVTSRFLWMMMGAVGFFVLVLIVLSTLGMFNVGDANIFLT